MNKKNASQKQFANLMSQSLAGKVTVSEDVFERRHMGITVNSISSLEQIHIDSLLAEHSTVEQVQDKVQIEQHSQKLSGITAEIRSIAAQSVLLHGERIKAAQEIFQSYRYGAFTKWLIQTYGNRQTPYSMLKYYEFHCALSSSHRLLLDKIPKKAAYQLAMRQGDQATKEKILQDYKGENQTTVIETIDQEFPPPKRSSRKKPQRKQLISEQRDLLQLITDQKETFTFEERRDLIEMGRELQAIGESNINL